MTGHNRCVLIMDERPFPSAGRDEPAKEEMWESTAYRRAEARGIGQGAAPVHRKGNRDGLGSALEQGIGQRSGGGRQGRGGGGRRRRPAEEKCFRRTTNKSGSTQVSRKNKTTGNKMGLN